MFLTKKEKEHLILETNNIILVNAFTIQSQARWEVRVLSKCVDQLMHFSQIRNQHCRREAHFIADWAAKSHEPNSLPSNWVVPRPQTLLHLLFTEAHLKGPFEFPSLIEMMLFSD